MRAILHRPESTQPIVKEQALPQVPSPPTNRQLSGPLTIACDITFLLMTVGAGLVLHAVVIAAWPQTGNSLEREMLEWMPFWAITTTAVWFLFMDGMRCMKANSLLPFDCTEAVVRHIYWQRFEIVLWAIASHLVLLCLCLLLPDKPLFSKVFLSSIVALAALAVRKSIPAQTLAFAASVGVFSFTMLVITIAGAFVH